MRFPVVVLVLSLALSAAAQRGANPNRSGGRSLPSPSISNSRDNQSIAVRLTTEDSRPLSAMVRVELLTSSGATLNDSFARDGMAQFDNVPAGSYRLRVTGPDIQSTTTESFSVQRDEKSMQFVSVRMLSTGQGGSTQGTVSAYELNVPEKAKAERRKGDEHLVRSEWKKAAEHLEKAVAIYPQYASAYYDLGYAYLKLGDKAKARQGFENAVKYEEHSGRALLTLARFAMNDGDCPESIRLVNRSLSLAPNTPEALTILANCELATGEYAAAVTNARKAHGMAHENYAIVHLIAGMALEQSHQLAEAVVEYQTFLKEDPKNSRADTARTALARLSEQRQAPAVATNPTGP